MSDAPPPAPLQSRWRRASPVVLLLPVLLVGGWLRLHRLGDVSYWFDEGFCIKMAEFSTPEIWERMGLDTRPPLYFLILKLWGAVLGTAPTETRLLSVLCGLLCIVGTYLFVCEAYAPRPAHTRDRRPWGAALLAAAMVALSPLHIDWCQQVNVYALGTALTACSSWLLLRALHRNRRILDWALFCVTAALLLYTHPYGIFTVAAQFLFAAGYVVCIRRRDQAASWGPLLFSALGVEFLWQFWLPSFLAQRARVTDSFWSSTLTLDGVGQLFYRLVTNSTALGSPEIGLWFAQGLILALLVLLLGRRAGDAYLMLGVAIPLSAALAYSALVRNVTNPQYLLFAQLLGLIAVAVLVWRLPVWLRVPAAAALLLGLGYQARTYYEHRERIAALQGLPAVLERVRDIQRPGEPVVFCNPMLYIPALPYLDRRDGMFVEGENSRYPFYHGTAVMLEEEYLSRSEIEDAGYHWIWTIDASRWFAGDWRVTLPRGWRLVSETRQRDWFCEVVLRLYEKEPDASPPITGDTAFAARDTSSGPDHLE